MDSSSSEVHRKDIEHDCTATLEHKEPKEKRFMTERMTVDDRSTSVSCWTLPMMCKYIDFRRDVSRWSRDHSEADQPSPEETSIQAKDSYEPLKIYCSAIRGIIGDQSTRSMTEAEVKLTVFSIFGLQSKRLGLNINAEETINLDCLPSCRLDFVLKSGIIPVGAIEVKREDSFDNKAFAQAVIQLLVLQMWAYKKGSPFHVDMTQVPIVHILTDGEKIVFMKLKGEIIYVQKSIPREKGSLHQELTVLKMSKEFGAVCELFQDALSHAVSKLRQLLNSHEIDGTCADGSQGAPPVHNNEQKYPNKISIHPQWNEHKWRKFLSPLKRGKKRTGKEAAGGFVDGTIEGPKSLSRIFSTKLGDRFLVKGKARVSEGLTIKEQTKKQRTASVKSEDG